MNDSGCVATMEMTVKGIKRKLPCPNNGVECDVAGESFSVKAMLCESHQKIAASEGLRVTPCAKPVEAVQSFE